MAVLTYNAIAMNAIDAMQQNCERPAHQHRTTSYSMKQSKFCIDSMKHECKKVDKKSLNGSNLHTLCDMKSSDHSEKLHPSTQNRIATPTVEQILHKKKIGSIFVQVEQNLCKKMIGLISVQSGNRTRVVATTMRNTNHCTN